LESTEAGLALEPDHEDAREGLAFAFKMRSPILGNVLKLLIAIEKIPLGWALVGMFGIL